MPRRVIDGEGMWSSSKLERCKEFAIVEYAWLYPLADANGSFELTNLKTIHGKVAVIRPSLTIDHLRAIFTEFHQNGLLFIWGIGGKQYGHWTGSDVVGRLPSVSTRQRFAPTAPPVPKNELHEYVMRHSRVHHESLMTGVGVGLGLEKGVGLGLEDQNQNLCANALEEKTEEPAWYMDKGKKIYWRPNGDSKAVAQ